jgi:hypothetical protein
MNIEDYTEKSFVVFGETKNHKETMKEMGGKYNSNLKVGPGWVFSKSNKEKVEEWLNSVSISKPTKIDDFFSTNKMINEFSSKIVEFNEQVFDFKKMDKYRMMFLDILVTEKKEISFQEFNRLDMDKIIMYSYLISSRTS